MRHVTGFAALALSCALLGGCESMPTGPTVAVMPALGKPFDLFQQEDIECRGYAARGLGPDADTSANRAFVGSAVAGTAIGAAVGGLAGGNHGAAGGAAVGLAAGSLVGAGQAQDSNYSLQQRYDITYAQCMYAKGNQLPPAPPPARIYYRRYYRPYYYYGP